MSPRSGRTIAVSGACFRACVLHARKTGPIVRDPSAGMIRQQHGEMGDPIKQSFQIRRLFEESNVFARKTLRISWGFFFFQPVSFSPRRRRPRTRRDDNNIVVIVCETARRCRRGTSQMPQRLGRQNAGPTVESHRTKEIDRPADFCCFLFIYFSCCFFVRRPVGKQKEPKTNERLRTERTSVTRVPSMWFRTRNLAGIYFPTTLHRASDERVL